MVIVLVLVVVVAGVVRAQVSTVRVSTWFTSKTGGVLVLKLIAVESVEAFESF